MSEWKEYKLGEVADILPGYAFKSKDFGKNGIPVIKIKDIVPPSINMADTERVDVRAYELSKISKYIIRKGDYVVAMTGATIGKIGKQKENALAYLNQRVARIKAKDGICDDFIYYSISSEGFQHFVQNNLDSNSVQENISATSIGRFPLMLPPLDEQKRIAGVLSSLDDKIDLLNRENATLEALAETLFRHYFIENPDPEWKEGKVSDIAIHCKDSINPQKHSDEIFLHYSIPAYDNGKHPTAEQGQSIQSNKYVIPQNCILFSKLNPHKDKRVWLLLSEMQTNAICSTEFQIVKPTNEEYLFFLYGWLTYKENYDEIASGVSGTSGSHQRIDPKVIFENECPIVDDSTIEQYNAKVKPLFEKIKTNQQQILSLTAQRDTLLPRIMIGEVIINE